MEALLVAFGVIPGTVTNELSFRWRDRRDERKAAKRVRTMVSVEIEQNVALASDYFPVLTIDYDEEEDGYREIEHEDIPYFRAWRLIALPLPPWRNVMWQSQLAELTTALNQTQISACHTHYGYLNSVAAAKSTLEQLLETQRTEHFRLAQETALAETNKRPSSQYRRHAPEVWTQAQASIEKLIALGNPLVGSTEVEPDQSGWRTYLRLPRS